MEFHLPAGLDDNSGSLLLNDGRSGEFVPGSKFGAIVNIDLG